MITYGDLLMILVVFGVVAWCIYRANRPGPVQAIEQEDDPVESCIHYFDDEVTTLATNQQARETQREINFQREARLSNAARLIGEQIAASDQRREYVERLNEECARWPWWSDQAHAIHALLIEADAAEEARQRALAGG